MKKSFDRTALSNTFWFLLLGAACFGLGWVVSDRTADANEKLLLQAYRLVEKEALYNDESPAQLAYAAVRGMLGLIEDPWGELIEPEAAETFYDTFAGDTGVVGLYAENQGGNVVITIVYPQSAAEAAGVQVGDVLLAIDGSPVDQATDSSEAGLRMRGAPGTTLNLEILRDGKPRSFELVRQERQFVHSELLPEDIGYIALYAYNAAATQQMKTHLEALLAQKPAALIWDLRSNEGGDMQAAQDILSFFIEDGLLFTAELTQGRTVQFMAKGKALAANLPLIVLMDQTTYSAAETCAAAIAEMGRGTTVGSNSYGKGLIQATQPLEGEAMLQISIAKWLSHRGEWYHEVGVPPQVQVTDDPGTPQDEVLQKGIELLLSNP